MATELGKAYVQIMPSAKGISGKIQKAIDPEATSAGKSAGGKISGLIKKTIVAAGIGMVIKSAVTEGAQLEQSIGGIETLFKGSADIVKKYADDAYKTAGLSANDYMENVTGFSASLLQSMGGDTKKAAKIANRAMIDMSDNSNKMGTDMGSIQTAYQGFAKQNYTMLDNLKLGYGGTKTEMQRLLVDAQKLTGVKYNIDNLADVYTAVGVIQDQLEITGTTALESQETISGSLSALAGAFKNTLGKLALGEDIKPSLEALASTLSTFLFGNLLPMVWNIGKELPGGIVTFILAAIPELIEAGTEILTSLNQGLVDNVPVFLRSISDMLLMASMWIRESLPGILQSGVEYIKSFSDGLYKALPNVIKNIGEILNKVLGLILDSLPKLLDAGFNIIVNLAKGIRDNWPQIRDSMLNVINSLLKTLVEKYPEYLKKGWEIIGKLAVGLWNNLPGIISTLGDIISRLIRTISGYLPQFIAKGLEVIVKLGVGLIKAIPGLVTKIPQIIGAILGAFGSIMGSIFNIGADIIKGLWNGINSVKDWILGKIGGFVDNVMGGIKKFFGIKSPSRLMADEVGKWLPPGLAVGIEGNTKPLLDTMEDLSDLTVDSFDPDLSFNGKSTVTTFNGGLSDKLDAMMNLLLNLLNRIEHKDEEDNSNLVKSIVQAFTLLAGSMNIQINERNFGKVILELNKKGYSL